VSGVDRVYGGYAFDLDGTVYVGESLLPHAADAVAAIRARGGRVVFVTNKPLETAAGYAAKLTRLGIEASAQDVVTAVDSLLLYLDERHPGARVLTVSEPLLAEVLAGRGYETTIDPEAAELVVVAFDRTFDYAKLNAAYRAVKLRGVPYVGTNPDAYCPTPDGGLPDCAAMLAAVEACTGVHAEAVLGKPGQDMARTIVERLRVPVDEVAMVGDRISTDVAMARSLGLTAILVLTGASTREDVDAATIKPDFVIDDLGRLLPAEDG
jgi:NagD protein